MSHIQAYLIHENQEHPIEIGDFLSLTPDLFSLTNIHSMSNPHARIEFKNQQFILKDLRSSQGTYVNGVRILEAIINHGDVIHLGEIALTFKINQHNQPIANEQYQDQLKSNNILWNQQLENLPNLAMTNYPILLLGPSGSGKEVIANRIHQLSCRRQGPLVKVNCGAFSETLIESELFGHIKGSFTGAIANRKGAFEAAREGTLFFDEIGDLPYGLQAKLLRAIENNEIRPLGSDRTIKTNVRIIAATHKNLHLKVNQGEFRQDLFYRLNVIQIQIPALKDRMEDFDFILFSLCRKYRVRFSHEVILQLKEYSWPGNIRELKNLVCRASAFYGSKMITLSELKKLWDHNHDNEILPTNKIGVSEESVAIKSLREFEKQLIIKKLIEKQGNQSEVAKELGIPKSTLSDRLKAYGISSQDFRKKDLTA